MKHIESHVKELGLVGIVFTCIYFQIWYPKRVKDARFEHHYFLGLQFALLGAEFLMQESGPSNCHQTSRRLGTFSKWNKSRDFWRSVSADVPVVSWSKSFISACTIDALWFILFSQTSQCFMILAWTSHKQPAVYLNYIEYMHLLWRSMEMIYLRKLPMSGHPSKIQRRLKGSKWST